MDPGSHQLRNVRESSRSNFCQHMGWQAQDGLPETGVRNRKAANLRTPVCGSPYKHEHRRPLGLVLPRDFRSILRVPGTDSGLSHIPVAQPKYPESSQSRLIMSQDFYCGLVSEIMSSWENDMNVDMMAASNLNHGSYVFMSFWRNAPGGWARQ